ncbi:hypothetical protein SMD20_47210 [Nonomuraea sp. LP-02]|uniref:hypothetical protein n=1 Tax=Nonomuraea sp. LP-02 TaxID=3097960 RepID=UPI002E30D927|nr:hypothetical protein [Nonomuraea sp. LP-02]MED7931882.1 hypothetical protein [Nonomuraea sp. LP-02]
MWPRLEGDFLPAIKFHRGERRVAASIIDWGDYMAIPAVANLINRQSQLATVD